MSARLSFNSNRRQAFGSLLALLVVAVSLAAPAAARAEAPAPPVPPGFHLIDSDIGIQLFKKDYPNGTPDYVQAIDLSQGAGVKLITGEMATNGEGKGAFGGASPKFERRSLRDFWREFTSAYATAFCITNGQFFLMKDSPTGLSFPVKVDSKIVTEGYAALDYQGQKLMFEIWPDHADIQPLTQEALYSSTAPEIVVGLTEIANKRAKQVAGRTFIGIDDRDQDGVYEIIYVFNTRTALQKNAAEVLRDFGADKVMMLDGGGSTQLTCREQAYLPSERLIPQVLGIWAGVERPVTLAATQTSFPSWPVLVAGEPQQLEFEFKNSGTADWLTEQDALVISKGAWGQEERMPLVADVSPDGTARIQWSYTPSTQWGIYPLQVSLQRGTQVFSGEPFQLDLVILPAELSTQRQALQSEIQTWIAAGSTDLERQVLDWTLQQLETAKAKTSPGPDTTIARAAKNLPTYNATLTTDPSRIDSAGIIWIPTTILPVAALLIFFLARARIRI